ncbi:hypothetical protein Enr13x_24080 [Stieleria neptunia]|uniref:Glycoside hydrolase family 42 N-terminal domain-containing protein n=1 Tax=Stieleria neptunia TaxID=2527979 RepID=A0A518HNY3_9BACT|nr:hypothetical protein [Stieleria neptunia]QDV42560.1 hypothetical protein Enr13x_24080 [Stieleria neptunia]
MNTPQSIVSVFVGLLLAAASACYRADLRETPARPTVKTESLWNPDRPLEFSPHSDDGSFAFQFQLDDSVSVYGNLGEINRLTLRAAPAPWDLSDYSALSIQMANGSDRIVSIHASVFGSQQRRNHQAGSGVLILLPGEQGALTIPFGFAAGEYEGNPAFENVAIKPNGHRQHWNPSSRLGLNRIELVLSSPADSYALESIRVDATFPTEAAKISQLEALPYVDRFGQCRTLDWPKKLSSLDELRSRSDRDPSTLPTQSKAKSPVNEPKKNWFQIKKLDGQWWFLDQQGAPFWSLGVARVGTGTPVRLWKQRQLYQWVPADPGGPFATAFSKRNGIGFFDYYKANAIREFGRHHRRIASARTTNRLNSWGVTTIGIHSDPVIVNDSKLPFAGFIAASEGLTYIVNNVPDPFSQSFAKQLSSRAEQIAKKLADRPRCMGIFVDEDQRWPTDLVSQVFARDGPARDALIQWLAKKYETIDRLNHVWETDFDTWKSVRVSAAMIGRYRTRQFVNHSTDEAPKDPCAQDIESLEYFFAKRYFSHCEQALSEHMPNHLYLGSRISYCSPAVLAACAEHADVISLNCFDPLPSCRPLPAGIDRPVLISRFHVGALDRGVPAMGKLLGHDQSQRERIFASYVVSALADPRIVGVHYDSYVDASIAAQPGEADRPGWVDITDNPYDGLTRISSRLSEKMTEIRQAAPANALEPLEELLKPQK